VDFQIAGSKATKRHLESLPSFPTNIAVSKLALVGRNTNPAVVKVFSVSDIDDRARRGFQLELYKSSDFNPEIENEIPTRRSLCRRTEGQRSPSSIALG
jgi:hypothetical protein